MELELVGGMPADIAPKDNMPPARTDDTNRCEANPAFDANNSTPEETNALARTRRRRRHCRVRYDHGFQYY
jgi:hypothetical protein